MVNNILQSDGVFVEILLRNIIVIRLITKVFMHLNVEKGGGGGGAKDFYISC